MPDQRTKGGFRPEVEGMLRAMASDDNGGRNIAAVHFDGPALENMLEVFANGDVMCEVSLMKLRRQRGAKSLL